jgi:two-component system, chemotaxis family, protein-glutamate methylesterase/glutaminase
VAGKSVAGKSVAGKTKVLIVDDSPLVRRLLQASLSGQSDIEVVGVAPDPYVARDQILELAPDVVTLDIEMPRMDGLSFLKRLMHFHPLPVIIISSLGQAGCEATLEALRLGAVDVLAKPSGPDSVGELAHLLPGKIRAAASAKMSLILPQQARGTSAASHPPPPRLAPQTAPQLGSEAGLRFPPRHLVAVGSSTGGTRAVEELLASLGANCPAMVITQHIPAGFSRAFAERLNKLFPFVVKEAQNGDAVLPGQVLIAPGNQHMLVESSGQGFQVVVRQGPLVCYQRPSVDVLFQSAARAAGAQGVGVILTGMGNDGAQGMKKMFDAGAMTIAQDEASCVVFGMPREAIAAKAVRRIRPLQKIGAEILESLLHGRTRTIPEAAVELSTSPLR